MKLKNRARLGRLMQRARALAAHNRSTVIVTAAVLGVFTLAAFVGVVGLGGARANPVTTLAAREIRQKAPPYNPPVDFEKLRGQNPDVVGWISAPLLGIDEPIVQARNNERYLAESFSGGHSRGGAVFLDYECDAALEGEHIVIYGHNLSEGGVFTPLAALKDADEFERCRDDITLYTPARAVRLRIVAFEEAPADAARRKTRFDSRGEFRAFAHSLINACELKREAGDYNRLYSFITCSYEGDDYRAYVYAVERA